MRTHVDLSETSINQLRELAARRGFRGYSRILTEAVEEYLARHRGEALEERAAKIERLRGSLSDDDAKIMRRVVREMRREKA
jgi:metal-responsive CopG/Arc/MetJ family transcriptional regulator